MRFGRIPFLRPYRLHVHHLQPSRTVTTALCLDWSMTIKGCLYYCRNLFRFGCRSWTAITNLRESYEAASPLRVRRLLANPMSDGSRGKTCSSSLEVAVNMASLGLGYSC